MQTADEFLGAAPSAADFLADKDAKPKAAEFLSEDTEPGPGAEKFDRPVAVTADDNLARAARDYWAMQQALPFFAKQNPSADELKEWHPSLWERFRTSGVGRKLLGPTEEEQKAMATGAIAGPPGGDVGLVPLGLTAPFPFLPGAETKAGKALLSYFLYKNLSSQPERIASIKDAFARGDKAGAWHEIIGDLIDTGMAGAAAHGLAGEVGKAVESPARRAARMLGQHVDMVDLEPGTEGAAVAGGEPRNAAAFLSEPGGVRVEPERVPEVVASPEAADVVRGEAATPPETVTVPDAEQAAAAPEAQRMPATESMTAEPGESPGLAAPQPEEAISFGERMRRRVQELRANRPADIIDDVEAIGKVLSKEGMKSGHEDYYNTEGYDLARNAISAIPEDKGLRRLFDRNGTAPDVIVDTLKRQGKVGDDFKVGDLWDAIARAGAARKYYFKTGGGKEAVLVRKMQEQEKDFEQSAGNPSRKREPVSVNGLYEGDTFTIKGHDFKVEKIEYDPDTLDMTSVTLEDGPRFGVQRVGADQVIYLDRGSLQKADVSTDFLPPEVPGASAPKLRTGEGSGELFQGEDQPFNLAGEKATDFERVAKEKAAAEQQRLEAEAIAKRQQQSLPGTEGPVHGMAAGGGVMAARSPGPTRRLPVPPAGALPPAVGGPAAIVPSRSFFGRLRTAIQSVVSPQNIDAEAKRFSFVLRENNARAALDLVRADEHLGHMRGYFDKTPVPKDWQYDAAKPLPYNFAVMDALERNRGALPRELQDWADLMDKEFAWRIAEVKRLKPGAMSRLITNYFPHMWENPQDGRVVSLMQEVAARAPLHGSKAFLQQRTLPLTVDGLARGLRPISDNPVDLTLAKLHQMDKFIMAGRVMEETKENGALKYFPYGRRIPAGRVVEDDPAFTVYAPPFVTVAEAYDLRVRQGLLDFMKAMGFSHERLVKMPKVPGVGNAWGLYYTGQGKIQSKFGGPDFVIMHEIGHGLEERYGLSRYLLTNSAMRKQSMDLAELRGQGFAASYKFKKYIRTVDEQMANVVHAYMYAPDLMAKVAPDVKVALENVIRAHPELEPLNEIRPGVALKVAREQSRLAGPVLAGHWTLPEGAAAVLHNFLSPGLGRFQMFRTLRSASNILNGAQLGLSAFHVGFTSLDAIVSSVATSMAYGLRGDLMNAAKSAAFAPVAPVANYYVGKAVQMKMVDPSATRLPILDFPRVGIKGFELPLSARGNAVATAVAELAVKGGLRADLDPFWKTHITRNLLRAVHEGGVKNYAKGALVAPWALVEQSMRPIAESLVPRQKLGVFAQLALQEMNKMGYGAPVDEVRAGMARAADATEDRMGQMTYDNLFYNKLVKDISLMGFRAYGWQLGKYRHLYGGLVDAAKLVTGKGGVTNRMLYPVALTMTAAVIGAIVHRVLTGKNPETPEDYLFPQNGQLDASGRSQRLMLPTYLKDMVSDWHDFPNLKKMGASFYHKLNPWIAATVDMMQNKDFYGVEIRHPDDPAVKQMADLGVFAAKQFTPFAVSGAMKLSEEKSPTAQLVLPFFGIVPAKKALTMTPAETLAADIIRDGLPVGARTREQWDHSQMLKDLIRDIKNNPPKGAGLTLPEDAMAKMKPGDEHRIISALTLKPLQYQVNKMSAEDAMRVWRLARADERQLLQQQIFLKVANSKATDPQRRTAYLQELVRGIQHQN